MTIGKFLCGSAKGTAALALAACAVAPAAHAGAGFGAVPGPGGCLRSPGSTEAPRCQAAKGLVSPAAIAVSPDGRNVYVVGGLARGNVAESFGAIAVLRRDPATGSLSEAGCLSSDGTDGTDGANEDCAASPALLAADGVTVSPDGHTVFVTASSSGSVVAFARDAESGSLTRRGCFQELPRPGSPCTGANVFSGAGDLVASTSALYVASALEGVISGLAAPPGAPTEGEPAGPASIFTAAPGPFLVSPCIAVNGYDGACAVGTAMKGVDALALSNDGNQLYATAQGSGAVDEFAPGARGTLTEVGCLKAAAPKGLCQSSRYLASPRGLAVTADGHNVYVADGGSSARPGGRVAVLARAADGRLGDSSCLDYLPPERHEEDEREGEDEGEGGESEKEPPAPPDPCAQVPGLAGAIALTVNAEGSTVSVFGPSSAATFSRDAATGRLTETSCAAAEDPRCSSLSGLEEVEAAAVSPDGRNVYLVTRGDASVLALGVGAAVTSSTAVASRAGTTAVGVACPRAMSGPCRGRVLLDRTVVRRSIRRHHHHVAVLRSIVARSAQFAIRPGSQAIVRVRVAHSARRLLVNRRRLRLTAVVRAAPRGGGEGFGRPVLLRVNRR
ncbi:MAG: 6-phosphogluconolactonase [Solirubrobacteraceae bacterium]|nr:6-phosphogluconolactonase [Solirubrobacteraceae bacterium]